MNLKSKRPSVLHPIVPSPEITSMSFKLHRTLDVMAAILIVILSVGTGAATALLQV